MKISKSKNTIIDNFHKQLKTKKITIGVTGFAKSGKTTFITALAQALRKAKSGHYSPPPNDTTGNSPSHPLTDFCLYNTGRLLNARICDDIKPDLSHFPYKKMHDCLFAASATWPEPTKGLSHLFVELECDSNNKFYQKTEIIQLELIDYPGEWLIDLPMLGQTYKDWSEHILALSKKGQRPEWSQDFFLELDALRNVEDISENEIITLADLWKEYLQTAASAGLTYNQPGRMLMPGTFSGSPMLRLFPLPDNLQQTPLGQTIEFRFEQYKEKVIRPFYRNYFSRMNRQVVLVDILNAMKQGQECFEEMEHALTDLMKSFKYSKNPLLSWLGGAKTTGLLVAATKADHVVEGDRLHLENFIKRWLDEKIDLNGHLKFSVKEMKILAIASICATQDCTTVRPPKRSVLHGQPRDKEKKAYYDPGEFPKGIPPAWDTMQFNFYQFEPKTRDFYPGELHAFPAINLGAALEFLIEGETNAR